MKHVKLIVLLFLLPLVFSCEKADLDESEKDYTEEKNDNTTDENGVADDNGNETGGNEGEGSTEGMISVADFINNDYEYQVWVVGYIVGCCTQDIKNADFGPAPFRWSAAILLADTQGETDTSKMISIQLKSGSKVRQIYNLQDHPENFGRRVAFYGYQSTYLKIPGIKNHIGSHKWMD